jgi:Tol biopolymer transport system component
MAHVEAPGYELASSPDGSELVTVVHRYFEGPGSYETLLMGTPGVQASFRPIVAVPSPSDPFAYAHPAYSPDGQKIAAVLSHSSDAIVVGKPGSELVPLWSPPDSRRIGRITWLRSGQGFLAHVYSADSNTVGDLFQISADGATTRMVVQGVSAFALWAQP